MFIRLLLIVILFPLQSCTNTLIGEKLENSFDTNENAIISEKIIANKDRLSQKSSKLVKKTIFNPQPYRIIIRLSGANPAAPAETVTEALRKAGVQFEVE